jgi:hypothetical protein
VSPVSDFWFSWDALHRTLLQHSGNTVAWPSSKKSGKNSHLTPPSHQFQDGACHRGDHLWRLSSVLPSLETAREIGQGDALSSTFGERVGAAQNVRTNLMVPLSGQRRTTHYIRYIQAQVVAMLSSESSLPPSRPPLLLHKYYPPPC